MKKNNFETLKLHKEIMKVISERQYKQMTEVQSECIPLLLSGQDLIGQSKTGSGKTAAFVIPILQKIEIKNNIPQALILCPTRELCDQVLKQVQIFSKYMRDFKIGQLVGGRPIAEQMQALSAGVYI